MTLTATPHDTNSHAPNAGTPTPAPAPVATGGAVPREVHNFLGDIEYLIEEITSITGEDLARAKARLGERIAEARHAVTHTGGVLLQETRRNADIANRYVQARPWTMIGIGVALGGLIGFLFARSR